MADSWQARKWDRNCELLLKKIDENQPVLPENKQLIRDFVIYLQARGSKPATVWRHVYSYEKLVNAFDYKVNIVRATREDVVRAVAKIEKLNVNAETKAKIKISLKFMFKHFNGEDLFYPREVAWIKTNVKRERKLLPDDLLTDEEIDKLKDNTLNVRDLAMIALMADAPLRTHELLLLKRKNLILEGTQPCIVIPENTKTGTRRIPLINSVPYLVQYLNVMKQIQPDDPLFMHELWNKERRPMRQAAVSMMLKKVASRAGIKKRVYPYLFRHSVITRYANKLSNAQLEKVAGWIHGTNMHMTYEHLSDMDLSNAVAKANGIKLSEDQETIKPRIKLCGRCKYTNAKDSAYCARCGGALSVEIALQEEKDKQSLDEAMERYLSNPKRFEELIHKVLIEDYRKKRR
jgi:integrase/recombinase XerD